MSSPTDTTRFAGRRPLSLRRRRPFVLPASGFMLLALLHVAACDDESEAPEPVTFPELVSSSPEAGEDSVPRTAWLVLGFGETVDPEVLSELELACDDEARERTASIVDATRVVVNPRGELPPASPCELSWPGPSGPESLAFAVAPAGGPAVVPYDRDSSRSLSPFPDDVWLVPDATTPTGFRVALPAPDRSSDVAFLGELLRDAVGQVDGFSPLAPMVIELPGPLDRDSLPMSPAESLEPTATIGLFDVDPSSSSFGERVPCDLVVRDAENRDGTPAHTLIVFSSHPLRSTGRYALVITRRALIDATRPLEASPFLLSAMDPDGGQSTDAERGLAAVLAGVLDTLEKASPPIHRDDIALVTRFSIRSTDDLTSDYLAIREQLDAMPAPTFTIDSVEPDTEADSPIAAIVRGTWHAPDWLDGEFFARDEEGRPRPNGTVDIPFALALPPAALTESVPIIIYVHGYLDTAEIWVPLFARAAPAEEGFAVIGFTDRKARLLGPEVPIWENLFMYRRMPDW